MEKDDFKWERYYKQTKGRQPRELLIDVMGRFDQELANHPHQAIDLGCGDGTETAYLLMNGWHVLAIDSEPSAFTHLKTKIPAEANARLQTQVTPFETVALSPADLIYAGYSVPFCHPHHFDTLWTQILANINVGGRFAGQLFGVNDTWASNPDMTFFTSEQVRSLFTGLEVEHFQEKDEDGRSTLGRKHWHVFHVIGRKVAL